MGRLRLSGSCKSVIGVWVFGVMWMLIRIMVWLVLVNIVFCFIVYLSGVFWLVLV